MRHGGIVGSYLYRESVTPRALGHSGVVFQGSQSAVLGGWVSINLPILLPFQSLMEWNPARILLEMHDIPQPAGLLLNDE